MNAYEAITHNEKAYELQAKADAQAQARRDAEREGWANFLGLNGGTNAEKFEAYQAQIARDFSAYEAQKQRDFEERMSSTAYSRAVEDMKRAGLNPYLMYDNGGYQASTPVGQSAQTVKASSHTTESNSKSAIGAAALLALAKIIAVAIA